MLYPEKTPQMCVINTPIKEVIKAFNDISEAYAVVEGSVETPSNPSSSLIAENMGQCAEIFNWYIQYWNKVAKEWFNHPQTPPPVREFALENASPVSQKLLCNGELPEKELSLEGTSEWVDNPIYNEDYNKYTENLQHIGDECTVSRIIIAYMQPTFEEFICGVPNWLSQMVPVVLRAYDSDNRRHIKIVNENGRYRYYTSIISDNFKEIKDVPPEMDKIVSYLISSKNTLTLANGREIDDFI